jgi:hypothetical protein
MRNIIYMNRLNAAGLLDESRKIVSLVVLSSLSAGAVIALDRFGGPLAAILGSVSVALASRLLYLAAMQPDTPNTPEGLPNGVLVEESQPVNSQPTRAVERPVKDEPLFHGLLTEL